MTTTLEHNEVPAELRAGRVFLRGEPRAAVDLGETIMVCAWCDPDKTLTKALKKAGYWTSHGVCLRCFENLATPSRASVTAGGMRLLAWLTALSLGGAISLSAAQSSGFRNGFVVAPVTDRVRTELSPRCVRTLSDAIYRLEGGDKTKYPYGIRSINTNGDKAKAQRICERTIRNTYQRWQGRPATDKRPFLDYLADRYCPSQDDPVGNRNWKKNIKQLTNNQRIQ